MDRPPLIDVMLAAALAAAAVATVIVEQHPWPVAVAAVSALAAATIAFRRVAAMAMALVFAGCGLLLAALPRPETPLWAFVALVTVCFSVVLSASPRHAVLGLAAVLLAMWPLQFATANGTLAEKLLSPPVIVGGAAVIGATVRRARHQSARLLELTEQLAAEREEHARAAARAERTRIARELHDVVAHTVTVMVVQAGAAEELLTIDPPAAGGAVAAIRREGTEAMAELRRLLQVLRTDEAESDQPQPGIADLPALVETAGVAATYTVRGTPYALPAGLELTVYRVVQEGLTNARRHAAGAAVAVRLVYGDGWVEVSVADDGPASAPGDSGGWGLVGLAERAALYGGEVGAGPRADAPGWLLRVALPVPAPADQPVR